MEEPRNNPALTVKESKDHQLSVHVNRSFQKGERIHIMGHGRLFFSHAVGTVAIGGKRFVLDMAYGQYLRQPKVGVQPNVELDGLKWIASRAIAPGEELLCHTWLNASPGEAEQLISPPREMVPLADVKIGEHYYLAFEGLEHQNGMYQLQAIQVVGTQRSYRFCQDSGTFFEVYHHCNYPASGSLMGMLDRFRITVYKTTEQPYKTEEGDERVPLGSAQIGERYYLAFEAMEQQNGEFQLEAIQVTDSVPVYQFRHGDGTLISMYHHRECPSYGSFLGVGRKVALYKTTTTTTSPMKQPSTQEVEPKRAMPNGCQISLKLVKPGQRYFLQFHGEYGALRGWEYDGEYTFVAVNGAGGYQFHGDKEFNQDNLIFDLLGGSACIEGKQVRCSVHELPDAKLQEDRCCNMVSFQDAVVGEKYVLKFGGDNARFDGKYTLESVSNGSWHDVFYKFSGSLHFNRNNTVGCTTTCRDVGIAYILNKPAPVSLYEIPETEKKKREAQNPTKKVPDLRVGMKCKMTFTCPQCPPSQESTVNQAYAGEYVLLTIRAKAGLPRVFKFVSTCGMEDVLLLNREEGTPQQAYYTRFGYIFAYCDLDVLQP